MRIIAGTARGTVIDAPLGRDTRPTLDRVRENVFNILQQQVRGARVLDLFSGSGAMAFEAVSRGAASAVLVLSLIHISDPRDISGSRMPSSA